MKQLPIERWSDSEIAAVTLGEHLFCGTLALVLGAGCTMPLGLPGWREMLQTCLETLGIDEDITDDADLELVGSKVKEECIAQGKALEDVVKSSIYRGDVDLLKGHSRLTAIGAMLVGDRRGSVKQVVTLNYDSFLEEYLLLCGYAVRPITSLPCLISSSAVSIYHIHGYLPSTSELGEGTAIALAKEDLAATLEDPTWSHFLGALSQSKVLLFVGVSEDSVLAIKLGKLLAARQPDYPLGFWIGAPSVSDQYMRVLRNVGIAPVVMDLDRIDRFITNVCRKAASRLGGARPG